METVGLVSNTMQQHGSAEGREVIPIVKAYREGERLLLKQEVSSHDAEILSVVNLSFVVWHMHGVQTKGKATHYIQNRRWSPRGCRNKRKGSGNPVDPENQPRKKEWSLFFCNQFVFKVLLGS